MNWMPRDIIALVLIIGGLALKMYGVDGVVSMILIAVAAFYFGAEHLKTSEQIQASKK